MNVQTCCTSLCFWSRILWFSRRRIIVWATHAKNNDGEKKTTALSSREISVLLHPVCLRGEVGILRRGSVSLRGCFQHAESVVRVWEGP